MGLMLHAERVLNSRCDVCYYKVVVTSILVVFEVIAVLLVIGCA